MEARIRWTPNVARAITGDHHNWAARESHRRAIIRRHAFDDSHGARRCSLGVRPAMPARSAAERIAADAQRAAPAGVTFVVPAVWRVKSDLVLLPDHGIGAVLLTNSDTGACSSARPCAGCSKSCSMKGRRRLAMSTDARHGTRRRSPKRDSGLWRPPPKTRLTGCSSYQQFARRAHVRREQAATIFDFGEWKSAVDSRQER